MAKPRKARTRTVKAKIYIFCEGEKTEPEYIRAYIAFKHPNCARLKASERPVQIEKTNKNTPIQLVDEAIKFTKNLEYKNDQVWVVYDRESEAWYSNQLHQEAYSKAYSKKINIALSNICFEYWLLLHLSNQAPAMNDCNSLINSTAFKTAFRNILKNTGLNNYDKSSASNIASALMTEAFLTAAKENAEKINQQTIAASEFDETKPYRLKPYTTMHKLLQAIDEVAKQ